MNSKSKKRIGIINHWMVNNYGALFLAYALEKKIHDLGYDVETITYLPDEVKKPWKLSMIKKIGFVQYLLRLGYFLVFILPRKQSFKKFRKRMQTSILKYSDKDLNKIDNIYDKIIIGGDQLWNCKKNYFNKNNFLPFIKQTDKKVVYAASIAQEKIPDDLIDMYKKLVLDFSYITTRESLTTKLLLDLTGEEYARVCDPAFLLDVSDWYSLCERDKKMENKDFIFVYQVQSDIELINFAKKLALKNKCKIVFCPFPLKKAIKCYRKPYISPEKWLWYINNAKYVVTDAFHGTVFSIIFNKDFYSQISSYGSDTSSRITQILEFYKLNNRLLNTNNYQIQNNKIDYIEINRKIQEEKVQSTQHLINMLNA